MHLSRRSLEIVCTDRGMRGAGCTTPRPRHESFQGEKVQSGGTALSGWGDVSCCPRETMIVLALNKEATPSTTTVVLTTATRPCSWIVNAYLGCRVIGRVVRVQPWEPLPSFGHDIADQPKKPIKPPRRRHLLVPVSLCRHIIYHRRASVVPAQTPSPSRSALLLRQSQRRRHEAASST